MRFESSKIAKIGQCELHDLQLAQWIFEKLDEAVLETVEKSNLYFWIYAEIFRDCLNFQDDFSVEVDKRLHDQNYVTSKIAEYERCHR